MNSLDWSLVKVFLTIAETGSLSGAARVLGSSQPTVGRQLKQLEDTLDVALFSRHARGFDLTDTGRDLLGVAEQMRQAMNRFALRAAGQDTNMRGTVRITASVFVSHFILPEIIAGICQAEPDIAIDLIPSDGSENLLFREADIAVRMYRSEQLDIVTKHLGDVELGIFAATSYLNRRGRPQTPADLAEHDLIGYDRNDLILRGMRDMGLPAQRDWFTVRCDEQAAYWQLIRAGCGIGFSQVLAAQSDPELERILPDLPIPQLPMWLAAPQAMRRTPRIRRVWDMLETGLKPFVS